MNRLQTLLCFGSNGFNTFATATAPTPGDIPPPRMYAAAAPRADGLLLLCGGRGADSTPLSDAFGQGRTLLLFQRVT